MVQGHAFHIFILLAVFKASLPQRRIKEGREVTSDKKYVVYMLDAPSSPHQYHAWLCGGAIIHKDYVITSAACVRDVKHIYVIAGYKKYVSADKLEEDACVKEKKKKVILTCVPKGYDLEYNKTEKWSKTDIAAVKVESSFDFTDKSYETVCSYIPQLINFNMDEDFPKPGDDVIALGWGHTKEFRKDKENKDLNQATLQYAPTKIVDVPFCVAKYNGNKALAYIIENSMLCTTGNGNIDDQGSTIAKAQPRKGCIPEALRLRGVVGRPCENEPEPMVYADAIPGEAEIYEDGPGGVVFINDTRRKYNVNRTIKHSNNTRRQYVDEEEMKQRRDDGDMDYENIPRQLENEAEVIALDNVELELSPGICQNDHGGPLVAWRGSHEILVAVATLFKLDMEHQCIGPFLFTKTSCNSEFLQCMVNPENTTRRRCNDPSNMGFEIVRRHISWVGHRDGPAENERIEIRHQVPMSAFHPVYKKSNVQRGHVVQIHPGLH